jgi:hypothetical protein
MRARNYRTEALELRPKDCYVLSEGDTLEASDLVYSWTTREFLRADSSQWIRPPLRQIAGDVSIRDSIEDLICAVRSVRQSEFASSVQKTRTFILGR